MIPVVGCCDIGGTTLRAALATRAGQLLARTSVEHAHPEPGETVETLVRTLQALAQSAQATLEGVGAAVPGPLDPERGIVHVSPNLGWRAFPFADRLARRLNVPVRIDDDANCAALGEQWRGSGQGVRDFIYVVVGTGIGAGLILNGSLYHGAMGMAGEVGHATILPDGPRCSCGNRGCLEALAAGPAIARAMQDAGSGEAARQGTALSAREVIAAARQGDVRARRVLHRAGQYLGIGLANVVNLLNPAVIALGGGVALDAGELLLAPARSEIRQRAFAPAVQGLKLELGRLGDDAGLYGAARLGWEAVDRRRQSNREP